MHCDLVIMNHVYHKFHSDLKNALRVLAVLEMSSISTLKNNA